MAEKTRNLGLTVFPNVSGVYQREIRIALVSGDECNMELIDAAFGKLQKALNDLVIPGIATAEAPGIVKPDGTTTTVNEEGVITAVVTVAVATVEQAGIVKPDGETILIDPDGTIRSAAKVDPATTEQAGIVKPDGDTILVEEDGTIRAAVKVEIATTEAPGIVKPDGERVSVQEDGTIVVNGYTQAEVDAKLRELSEMLISDVGLNTLGAAVNALMDTEDTYNEIGTDLITLDSLVNTLLS